METSQVTVDKIKSRLSDVPQERLDEVYDFIEFLLTRPKYRKKNIVKLEGVWKGLGFEKLNDLESQIRKIRRDSDRSIGERVKNWNI
jgi:hypothetical protein